MARPHERVQGHGAAVPAAFLLRKRRPAARAGQARPRLPHPGSHLGRHGQSRARGLPRRGRRVHRRHVPRRRRERHPVQADGHAARAQRAGMGRARKLRRLPDGREKRVRRRGLCEEAAGRAPHRSFQRELHQLGAPHAPDRVLRVGLRAAGGRRQTEPGRRAGRMRAHGQLRQHPGRLLRQAHGRAAGHAVLRQQREPRAHRLHQHGHLRHIRAPLRADALAVHGHPRFVEPGASAVRAHGTRPP